MLTPPAHWSDGQAFEFNGVRLLDTDVPAAVESVVRAAEGGHSQGLHLCNAYTLTLAAGDSAYRRSLEHSGAVNLPDGTPVSWFYRLANRRSARGPVRGPSLMKGVLARPGLRHYLLGGTPEVLQDLESAIARDFPAATVVGRTAPPFHDPDEASLSDWALKIKESRADIVWVGLGTPRQDHVIAALVGRVDAVFVGVGAAFDFLSGHKSEAPEIFHRSGFEWLYRLWSEPRRLWRRYLVGNVKFVVLAVRHLVRARRG